MRDDNRPSAETEVDVRAYFVRKQSISVRSALVLVPCAIGCALWAPVLGLSLALGGVCGVANMLLVMRNNERLLTRGRSRAAYGASNTVRLLAAGIVPALAVMHHPWWYLLIAIAGFFTPLGLYSFALRREFLTG